jgi:hypothetical protein
LPGSPDGSADSARPAEVAKNIVIRADAVHILHRSEL